MLHAQLSLESHLKQSYDHLYRTSMVQGGENIDWIVVFCVGESTEHEAPGFFLIQQHTQPWKETFLVYARGKVVLQSIWMICWTHGAVLARTLDSQIGSAAWCTPLMLLSASVAVANHRTAKLQRMLLYPAHAMHGCTNNAVFG